MAEVRVSVEGPRGCGYRKPGGIYLVSRHPLAGCGRFPFLLDTCPVCSQGIKPARGWTWVDGEALIERSPCKPGFWEDPCDPGCMYAAGNIWRLHRAGLLWVGEKYYPDPAAFLRESAAQGISRRIKAVPKEFVLKRTVVLLAHRRAVPAIHAQGCKGEGARSLTSRCGSLCVGERPGVFAAFIPMAVEYVIRGNETSTELNRLESRGLSLVEVRRG